MRFCANRHDFPTRCFGGAWPRHWQSCLHAICHVFFEGNPMDAFVAFIAGEEYGADETPDSLGLCGGCYMIVFRPGESW